MTSLLRPRLSRTVHPGLTTALHQVFVFVVLSVLTQQLQDGRDQEEDAGDEDGEGHRHGQGGHLRGAGQGCQFKGR